MSGFRSRRDPVGQRKAPPDDPVALAIRGSLIVITADALKLPWKKIRLLNEGLAIMDRAVALIPQAVLYDGRDAEIEIRMIRGITCAALPPPFRRDRTVREDLSAILASDAHDTMDAADQAEARAWLAVVCRRMGDEDEATRLQAEAETLDSAVMTRIRK